MTEHLESGSTDEGSPDPLIIRDRLKREQSRRFQVVRMVGIALIAASIGLGIGYLLGGIAGSASRLNWLAIGTVASATLAVIGVLSAIYAYGTQLRAKRQSVTEILNTALDGLWSDDRRQRAASVETIRELMVSGALNRQQLMTSSQHLKHWAAVNWSQEPSGPSGSIAWARATGGGDDLDASRWQLSLLSTHQRMHRAARTVWRNLFRRSTGQMGRASKPKHSSMSGRDS
jgi:hypothetical protein